MALILKFPHINKRSPKLDCLETILLVAKVALCKSIGNLNETICEVYFKFSAELRYIFELTFHRTSIHLIIYLKTGFEENILLLRITVGLLQKRDAVECCSEACHISKEFLQ